MSDPEQIISAEVLLRSVTGARINGNTIITAENMAEYAPAAETVRIVTQFFKDNGFEVTPLVGIGFTIYGMVEHFSRFFHTSLTADEAGGIRVIRNSQTTSAELPLSSLPKSVADLITTVTFVTPPDFGPTQFR